MCGFVWFFCWFFFWQILGGVFFFGTTLVGGVWCVRFLK